MSEESLPGGNRVHRVDHVQQPPPIRAGVRPRHSRRSLPAARLAFASELHCQATRTRACSPALCLTVAEIPESLAALGTSPL